MFRFGLKMAIVGLLLSPSLAQAQKANATLSVTSANVTVVGKGSRPRWSPDGKYLGYLGSGKARLYDVTGDSSFAVGPALSEKFEWFDNQHMVFSHTKYFSGNIDGEFKVTSIAVDGKMQELYSSSFSAQRAGWTLPIQLVRSTKGHLRILDLGTASVHTLSLSRDVTERAESSLLSDEYFVIANRHAELYRKWGQEPNNDIWLINASGDPIRRIVEARGGIWMSPKLSDDAKLVLVEDGWGEVVYTVAGKLLGSVHPASGGQWVVGSSSFVYERVEDDGLRLTASDIYISDSSCTIVTQLTHTPDKIELYPVMSPDGNKLAYTDYLTGKLEIYAIPQEASGEEK